MSGFRSRSTPVLSRLKQKLKDRNESLAGQFEFCIYIAFALKSSQKHVLYKCTDVLFLMNSQFEEKLKSASEQGELRQFLLEDTVQLHACKFSYIRKEKVCAPVEMNFLMWPRSDISSMTCTLLSRWKGGDPSPFRCLQQPFTLSFDNLHQQIDSHLSNNERDLVVSSASQNMFVLVEKLKGNKGTCCVLKRLCLFVPQSSLTVWNGSTEEEVLASFNI